MGQNDGLAYFIAEPPEYDAVGDNIIGRRNGREFVMPIWVAQQTVARLERALAKWQLQRMSSSVTAIRGSG